MHTLEKGEQQQATWCFTPEDIAIKGKEGNVEKEQQSPVFCAIGKQGFASALITWV